MAASMPKPSFNISAENMSALGDDPMRQYTDSSGATFQVPKFLVLYKSEKHGCTKKNKRVAMFEQIQESDFAESGIFEKSVKLSSGPRAPVVYEARIHQELMTSAFNRRGCNSTHGKRAKNRACPRCHAIKGECAVGEIFVHFTTSKFCLPCTGVIKETGQNCLICTRVRELHKKSGATAGHDGKKSRESTTSGTVAPAPGISAGTTGANRHAVAKGRGGCKDSTVICSKKSHAEEDKGEPASSSSSSSSSSTTAAQKGSSRGRGTKGAEVLRRPRSFGSSSRTSGRSNSSSNPLGSSLLGARRRLGASSLAARMRGQCANIQHQQLPRGFVYDADHWEERERGGLSDETPLKKVQKVAAGGESAEQPQRGGLSSSRTRSASARGGSLFPSSTTTPGRRFRESTGEGEGGGAGSQRGHLGNHHQCNTSSNSSRSSSSSSNNSSKHLGESASLEISSQVSFCPAVGKRQCLQPVRFTPAVSGSPSHGPCVFVRAENASSRKRARSGTVTSANQGSQAGGGYPNGGQKTHLNCSLPGNTGLRGLLVRPGQRDEIIIKEVLQKKAYERKLMGFEVEESDNWLDIGAHIGVFSSLVLRAGANCVSVEPDSDNFNLLKRNVALNFPQRKKIVVRAAVLGSLPRGCCTTTLFQHPTIPFRHSTIPRNRQKVWGESIVQATTVAKLLHKYPMTNAIKIDIQGSEVDVIACVEDWKCVRKLVFEYDFEYHPDLGNFHAFVLRLKSHFPVIHHPKLNLTGRFKGFPNGIVVFAMRSPY